MAFLLIIICVPQDLEEFGFRGTCAEIGIPSNTGGKWDMSGFSVVWVAIPRYR